MVELSSQFHLLDEDSPHLPMVIEAGRRRAAKEHGIEESRVKHLWSYGPKEEGKYHIHYGWASRSGHRTGATYSVSTQSEHIKKLQTWPEYKKEDSPYADQNWGD